MTINKKIQDVVTNVPSISKRIRDLEKEKTIRINWLKERYKNRWNKESIIITEEDNEMMRLNIKLKTLKDVKKEIEDRIKVIDERLNRFTEIRTSRRKYNDLNDDISELQLVRKELKSLLGEK